MAENKITHMTDLLQAHHQHIRTEEHTSATYTDTTSDPTTIGHAAIITLDTDATFSDTPEEPYMFLSIFPFDIPLEKPTSV